MTTGSAGLCVRGYRCSEVVFAQVPLVSKQVLLAAALALRLLAAPATRRLGRVGVDRGLARALRAHLLLAALAGFLALVLHTARDGCLLRCADDA